MYHKRPCLVLNTQPKVDEDAEPEESGEKAICFDAGIVSVESTFDGTFGTDFGTVRWIGWRDSHCVDERGSSTQVH